MHNVRHECGDEISAHALMRLRYRTKERTFMCTQIVRSSSACDVDKRATKQATACLTDILNIVVSHRSLGLRFFFILCVFMWKSVLSFKAGYSLCREFAYIAVLFRVAS